MEEQWKPLVFLSHCGECHIVFRERMEEESGHHLCGFIIAFMTYSREDRDVHFLYKMEKRRKWTKENVGQQSDKSEERVAC